MRKQTQVPKSPTELRNQLLQQANTVTALFKDTEYAEDFVDEIEPTTRSEVAPPLKPPKDRFNVSFKGSNHPYFEELKNYFFQNFKNNSTQRIPKNIILKNKQWTIPKLIQFALVRSY